MPGGDGTGPMGMGQRTGRGAGRCGGNSSADFENAGGRRSFQGSGGGRGWRNRFWAAGLTGCQRAWSGFCRFGRGLGGLRGSRSEFNPSVERDD